MELISQLGIEWKLLVAQIINFLVLLFVLRKFAYKPIVNLLKQRSEQIDAGLRAARKAEEELARIQQIEADRKKEIEALAVSLIEDAKKDAKKIAQELVAKSEQESARLVEEAKRSITLERVKMLEDVRRELIDIVLVSLEKIVREGTVEKERARRAEEVISLFLQHNKAKSEI